MLSDMSARDQIRAADADRDKAAERLREALAEGRLDLDELDERLRDVYAARTFGDLDRVLADLPTTVDPEHSQLSPATPKSAVPPSRHEPNPVLPGWLSFLWRLWFVAVGINLVIWFVVSLSTGGLVYFWPIWVAGPWAAVNAGLLILFPPRRPS
jgi:hypothetical protein